MVWILKKNIWRFLFPPSTITEELPWIHGGDIVAIVTSIEGLDIAHVGIAVYVGGRLSLLHASQAAGRVVVSSDSLADLLAGKKSWAGIRVVRRRQP